MYLHSLIGGASTALRRAAEVEDRDARLKRSEQELKEGICKPVLELGEKLSALSPDHYDRQFRMRVTENAGDIFIKFTYHQPPLTFSKEDSTGRGSAHYMYTLQDEHRDREHEKLPPLTFRFSRLYDRHDFIDSDVYIEPGNGPTICRKPGWILSPQIDSDFCVQKLAEWCGRMAPDRVAEIAHIFAEAPATGRARKPGSFTP